jgi:hypothetical protein
MFASCTTTALTNPVLSTSKCRFLPLIFLPPSNPRMPPFSVVLAVWESITAALGVGSLPARRRSLSRRTVWICSQVPSMRATP